MRQEKRKKREGEKTKFCLRRMPELQICKYFASGSEGREVHAGQTVLW